MESFHAATADLMSAAQFARCLTKRGVNHGELPVRSGVTKICPSQSGPLPMPMVSTVMAREITFATGGVKK